MPSQFKKHLEAFEDSWEKSQGTFDEMFTEVPEGIYIGRVQSAKLYLTNNGNLKIRREFLVTEGEYAGTVVNDMMNPDNEIGLVFIRRWLDIMNVEKPESFKQIEKPLKEITSNHPLIKFMVKKPGDFTNVKTLELLDDEDDNNEWNNSNEENSSEETEIDNSSDETDENDEGNALTPEELMKMSKKDILALLDDNEIEIDAKVVKLAAPKFKKAVCDILFQEAENDENNGLIEKTKDFMKRFEILDEDLTDSDDIDALKDEICMIQWEDDELEEDDKNLLKELEIFDDVVVKPKKQTKPAKKLVLKKK